MQKPLKIQGFANSKSIRKPMLYPLSYGRNQRTNGRSGASPPAREHSNPSKAALPSPSLILPALHQRTSPPSVIPTSLSSPMPLGSGPRRSAARYTTSGPGLTRTRPWRSTCPRRMTCTLAASHATRPMPSRSSISAMRSSTTRMQARQWRVDAANLGRIQGHGYGPDQGVRKAAPGRRAAPQGLRGATQTPGQEVGACHLDQRHSTHPQTSPC